MDWRSPGGIPFNAGFAPGTLRRCIIYFSIPIALGFGLYNITNKFTPGMEEEVQKFNPKMVPIHKEQSQHMFNKVREDNKKFLEEFHQSYKSQDKTENKEEKSKKKKK
eukprot:Phypoly_transcript_31427.p1 GENE.Phypoly_transcript_31427~~Phypoly_transcript_31427.p1  ORF type:complete len:108 (+),score=22.13 Phypoly_transcript_31427:64-387(+)